MGDAALMPSGIDFVAFLVETESGSVEQCTIFSDITTRIFFIISSVHRSACYQTFV